MYFNMDKLYFLLFLSLALLKNTISLKVPYDVAEDAQTQLEILRELVLGNIKTAEIDLDDLYLEMQAYSVNVRAKGKISIDQVYAEVAAQLQEIKDLAASANKDISRCTGGREQMIHRLPGELEERMNSCIVTQNEEAADVLDSSKYLVDITINRVHSFEFQLELCGNSSACISPILANIETDTTDLPLKIKAEVVNARDLINKLKVLVQECSDTNVADFTGYVTELLEQIAKCADQTIDMCNGSCLLPVCCV